MLHDVAGPGLVVVIGWGGFLLASPFIVLAEAVVLRLLKWGTFWKSLLDAFIVNLVSTLVGATAFAAGFLFAEPAAIWLSLLIALILSVAIEGGVLLLLKRHPGRQTWLAALIANLVSYAGLALVILLTVGV
jgi:hypothetical protein